MTDVAPTLAQQIEAVEWAIARVDASDTPMAEVERMEAALAAAVETLKTTDFMRETLR